MSQSLLSLDGLLPFQLESNGLRGRLVRLGPVLDLVLGQHAYPEPVARLLGEAMAMACALAATLKYDGIFTLQAKGDGPVRLLVADVTSDGGIRAYAQFDAERLARGADAGLGAGYLSFTVRQAKQDDPYQGIVELKGDSLTAAVQHYFRQSEQLPTGILAECRRDGGGHWHAGCLILQRMPREGGHPLERSEADPRHDDQSEDWQRAMMLMSTCAAEELTGPGLPAEDLLYRLFHEEGVRVFDPHQLRHQCRCSDERVTGMLRSLPRAEVEDLAVNGLVEVTCEFCNRAYRFDAKRREEIYAE